MAIGLPLGRDRRPSAAARSKRQTSTRGEAGRLAQVIREKPSDWEAVVIRG